MLDTKCHAETNARTIFMLNANAILIIYTMVSPDKQSAFLTNSRDSCCPSCASSLERWYRDRLPTSPFQVLCY